MAIYEGLAEADAEAAVTTAGEPPAEGQEPGAALPAEVTPTRPRTSPGQALADRIRNRARSGGKGRGRGASRGRSGRRTRVVHERVSVSGVIEWVWAGLAQGVRPVSDYTARVLAMQAPVAGDVLEDSIRGTFVDRALQPIARGQTRIKGVGALFVLPVAIAGLEAAEGLPERARAVRRAFLVPMAQHGAVLWIKVAGPKIKERIEREAEEGPIYAQGAELLVFMNLPFLTADDLGVRIEGQTADGPPPEGGSTLSAEEARDMAARAAQGWAESN